MESTRKLIGQYRTDVAITREHQGEVEEMDRQLNQDEMAKAKLEIAGFDVGDAGNTTRMNKKLVMIDEFRHFSPDEQKEAKMATDAMRRLMRGPFTIAQINAKGLEKKRNSYVLVATGVTARKDLKQYYEDGEGIPVKTQIIDSDYPQWNDENLGDRTELNWKPGQSIRVEWRRDCLCSDKCIASITYMGDDWLGLLKVLQPMAAMNAADYGNFKLEGPQISIRCKEFPEAERDMKLIERYILPGTYWFEWKGMSMNLRCPGYLNAKSLAEDDVCREDYVDWFSHSALAPYRPLIESVSRILQYHGNDPVLLVGDVASDSSLLFRFTMRTRDRLGRAHQRCEVLLVPRSKRSAFLNGTFRARPDADGMEFAIETAGGRALPYCESRRVRNVTLGVYARNFRDYWFKDEVEEPSRRLEPSAADASDSGKNFNQSKGKKGSEFMCKALLVLWAMSCGLGIWNHVRSANEIERLRASLKACQGETSDCRTEIANLRRDKSCLQKKIAQYDKWIATRSNFEHNQVELRSKCAEIILHFREMENLLSRIDEAPQTASSKEIDKNIPAGGGEKGQNPHKDGILNELGRLFR